MSDLLIIGAGSAGFAAAITAAEQGANVTMIGDGDIGGTCVNIGCIPSKTLIRAMDGLHNARQASQFNGIHTNAELTDWAALITQKNELVQQLRQSKYSDVIAAYDNISYVEGRAQFTPEGVMANGVLYRPQKTVIATGSAPSVPPIDGVGTVPYLTSTTAMELTALPKSLMIIGGGVIGVELGQMFARTGTKVTICCRSRLVPETEPEISEQLAHYLQEEGIDICAGIKYQKIEKSDMGTCLTYEKNGAIFTINAEQTLIATGRKPNTVEMGLQEAGIATAHSCAIKINQYMQTSNKNVYAVGDVTGNDMFVYMAAYGGKIAALNAINGNELVYNNDIMPTVVFTNPQVADVGLTELEAKQQNINIKTSSITLKHVPRFIAARDTRGLIKLIADSATNKLLGAHILAPEAGEIIQTAAMAIKAQMTIDDLAHSIFPYLTGVEGLKLAAQTFDKNVNKLSCCAG
jgi:mercuric reductase